MNVLKIALAQIDIKWGDVAFNLQKYAAIVDEVANNADIIVFPEMFATGFTVENAEYAEQQNGRIVSWINDKAVYNKTAIAGSVFIEENKRLYNRFVCVKGDGSMVYYNKRHLFRMGNEHHLFSAGKTREIFNILDWKLMPLVCYDLRFPVWSMNRCINGCYDYDVLLYVANWPSARADIWKSLLIARAIENQCYVIGVNRVGNDANGTEHQGNSMLINYKGQIIKELQAFKEEIGLVSVSLDELHGFRKSFNVSLDWDEFEVVL